MILTFEKIRALQWKEKNEKKLQELPENFYEELQEYVEKSKQDNAILVAKDLIDTRTRKIFESVINYFKTKEIPVNMTKEEKEMFYTVLEIFSKFRESLFKEFIYQKEEKKEEIKESGFVIVTENLPCFVGPDLKIYDLKKNDKVFLPEDLKNLLIKYGYCKKIE
jgi:DNA replication initiation complex subunit (GINS family)